MKLKKMMCYEMRIRPHLFIPHAFYGIFYVSITVLSIVQSDEPNQTLPFWILWRKKEEMEYKDFLKSLHILVH